MTRDQTRTSQVILREVNERIADITVHHRQARSLFVCECGQRDCTDYVDLDLGEYREIRSSGDHFVAAMGHCVEEVDRVVESRDGFDVLAQL